MSYQLATGTRIWQHEDTKEEHAAPVSFLWEMVTCMQAVDDAGRHWQHQGPKTCISLSDDSVFYVQGKFEKWRERWLRFLATSESRTLLFAN